MLPLNGARVLISPFTELLPTQGMHAERKDYWQPPLDRGGSAILAASAALNFLGDSSGPACPSSGSTSLVLNTLQEDVSSPLLAHT